jgi:hypothetical protein
VRDQSNGKKRPVLRLKNRGGAPKGNRNPLKHGAYTKERLQERRALRAEVASVDFRIHAAIAHSNLATIGKRPKVIVTKIEL